MIAKVPFTISVSGPEVNCAPVGSEAAACAGRNGKRFKQAPLHAKANARMIFLTRNTSESGDLTCFVVQESGRKVPNLVRPELIASRRRYRFGGVVGFLVDVAVEVVEVGWTKPSVRVCRNATRSSSS